MVRRPLFYITAAAAASTAAAFYMDMTFTVLTAAALAASGWMAGRERRKRARALMLMVAAYGAGVVNFWAYDLRTGESGIPIGDDVEVAGRVQQVNIKQQDEDTIKVALRMQVSEAGEKQLGKTEKALVNVYVDLRGDDTDANAAAEIAPGDVITVRGEAEKPSERRNPGCFDYSVYLETIGIRTIVTAAEVVKDENEGAPSLAGMLYDLREDFIDRLEARAGVETAAMTAGVLFGQTDDIDEDTLEEFRMNGTAHILSVSGLHIGIIYGVISWLWRWKKGRLYFALTIAFFVCYMIMASFSAPVVRAVIMVGLHLLARLLRKRYDLESAVYLAALILLAYNPLTLFNTGFQMSFMAMISLALVMPVVRRFYSGVLLSGLSVQLGLLPYTAYMFNYVSLGSVAVNIPIIFISGLLVPLGLASMGVLYVSEALFGVMAELLGGLCVMMTELNSVTTVEGVTVFTVTSPDIRLLLMYYLLIFVFAAEEGRLLIIRHKRACGVAVAAVAAMMSLAFGSAADSGFDKANAVFVDVGQGDCVHIKTEDGKNYMIDGGGSMNYSVGEKTLKPYLLKNGVRRLDGIFVTHLHADHYKGAAELCREGMAERLFLYEGNIVREDEVLGETGLDGSRLTYLYAGQRVELSEDVSVEVLWPEKRSAAEYETVIADEEDENSASLVFKVTVAGAEIMMTGDIDEECQEALAEEYGDRLGSDILKAPHHGSKYSYSSEFMECVDAGYAVFQVGKNNFGHPDKGVVENYSGEGIIIYRNDEDGAVGFEISEDGVESVRTVTGGKEG